MLSDHNLHRCELARVFIVLLALECHQLESRLEVADAKVRPRQHLDAIVPSNADNGRLDVIERAGVTLSQRLIEYALADFILDIADCRSFAIGQGQCHLDHRLEEVERVVANLHGRERRLARYGHREHVKRVKRDRHMVAEGAIDSRFQLSVEEFDED